MGRADRACVYWQKAVELTPESAEVYSDLLFTLHYLPGLSRQVLFNEARNWERRYASGWYGSQQPAENDPDPDRPLRVGYVSPDFRVHTVGRFVAPVIAAHDPGQVLTFCYSHVGRGDALTEQIRRSAHQWRDTVSMNDDELADLVRRDAIDIVVDLAGHMAGGRLQVFARKPAPIQVSWAYADTTGLTAIDYRLTDELSDPRGMSDSFHTERLVRLPNCAWPYTPDADAPPVVPPPALSTGRVTFGCLNNAVKLSDPAIELWSRILTALPGARLALLSCSPNPELLSRFARHGIVRGRLELVPRRRHRDYMEQFNRIDIALDPFPYNGDTSTCDALWMGVPVVTLEGDSFVSRRGLSQLTCIGLPELVAANPQQYVDIAVRLACDPQRLANLRGTLRDRMRVSPLTDGAGFTAHLEQAYRQMWQTWCDSRKAAASSAAS